jgi:AraC-like DNA-binding protein
MKRKALKLSFDYMDTPERRVLSLDADGVPCVPVLGFDAYRRQWRAAPIHVHDECMELSLCLRGNLEFEMGGKRYPFRPGSVFVARPDEPHRLRSYPKGMSKYWLLFRLPARGERILGFSARETAWFVQELTHLPRRLFAGTKGILSAFKRLFALCDNLPARSVPRRVRIRAAVVELLLEIVEAAHTTTAQQSPERIADVIAAVRADLARGWTIDELATRVGCSHSKLLLAFKQQTGAPPHAFLLACRIERAKELLAAGSDSVAAIARALGFASPQHFAGHFKLATGQTPREWRAKAKMCAK